MSNLGGLNIWLSLDAAQFKRSLENAKNQTEGFAKKAVENFSKTKRTMSDLNVSAQNISKSLNNLALFSYAQALPLREIIQVTDAWTGMGNQLRYATNSTREYKDAQAAVLTIADKSRSSLEGVTSIYAKIAENQELMNISGDQVGRVTETISKSLTLFSRTAQEATSAQLQLGQALGSGRLQGDEYKTLRENASGLVTLLAKTLNVSRAQLDQMATNGELTSDRLAQAFLQMSDDVDSSFAQVQSTIGQALTVAGKEITKLIGNFSDVTGAAEGVANAIIFAAKNFDVAAKAAGAAGVGFLAYKVANIGIVGAVTKSTTSILAFTATNYAATTSLRFSTIASIGLSNAMKVTTGAAVRAGIALKGLVFSPLGAALIASAGAFYYLTQAQDDNRDSIDRLGLSVDEYTQQLQKLSKIQLNKEAGDLKKQIDNQIKELEHSAFSVDFGSWAANGFRNMFLEIARQNDLTKEQMDTALRDLIAKYKNESVFKGQGDDLLKLANNILKAKDEFDELKQKQDALNESMKTVGKTASSLDLTPKGMEKWDEYLKNLEDTRNVVGLNARQLGEYQARRKGASEEEARVAGIVSAQTSAFGDLQSAIQDKDAKAAQAAKDNIRNLERERIQVYYLAQEMLAIMEAANQFAISGVSPDVAMGAIAKIKETFALAREGALTGVDKQIANLENNTTPKTTKSKGGGSKSQNDELKNLTKSLQEQIAVLGMTDTEAQKYKISQMQGSEAAKVMAASLVDTIARHKEEAETLKQNSALFEELAVFRNQQFEPLMMMGMGDRARDQMSELLSIQADYAAKRRELSENQESESTRISDAAYQVRLDKLIEAENQKLAVIEEAYRLRQEKEANWSLGVSEALNNYSSEAANVYQSMNNAVSGAFKGMEDALVSFVTTGKADFKSLANSIISDMVRIAVQQSIMGPLSNALGGMFGASHSFGGAGTVASVGHNFTIGGFATGGYTGHGSKYDPAGIVHRGEGVLSQDDMRSLGGVYGFNLLRRQLRGYSTGGVAGRVPGAPAIHGGRSQGSVQVNITNQASQPVSGNAKLRMDEMGRMVIDVMLFDLNSNGRYTQALKHSQG